MRGARDAGVSPAVERGGGGSVVSRPCQVWGVLNVTPDSFSDGGRFAGPEQAVEHGLQMWRAGAWAVDVGGESTRPPGATYGEQVPTVAADEELQRVVPVVRALCEQGVRVSIDTTKPEVAAAALEAGAVIVNDVSMGRSFALVQEAARAGADLVLMHNRGRGEREGERARYSNVIGEALEEVLDAVESAVQLGVPRERLWIDPGLGFAKAAADSARLLANLGPWIATGYPVLVGASRKSFLARLGDCPDAPPGERLPASLVAACVAQAAGCAAVRVHDVPQTLQALRASAALAMEAAR